MAGDLNAYLLIVASKGLPVKAEQLQQFIVNNKHIDTWWNYIPLVYAITSKLDYRSLEKMFTSFFADSSVDYLLAKFDPTESDGSLPRTAWDGFLKDIQGPTGSPE